MKIVPFNRARHGQFVGSTFKNKSGHQPSEIPSGTRTAVAETDTPDEEGRPVFMAWAAVNGQQLVWLFVKARFAPLGLDEALLRQLGAWPSDDQVVEALFDGVPIRSAARRYGWDLRIAEREAA